MEPVFGSADLQSALGVCDQTLGAHASRVAANAEAVALRLGWQDDRLEALRLGAVLHDVGKVAVRPEVLAKPGGLDEAELAEIRAHPVEGMWMLLGTPGLHPALPYVLFHHERWDGGGYPTRRAGTAIPLEGRVLAVADAFDAMTSARPYRPTFSATEAAEEIDRCSGTQFDPEIAGVFLATLVDGGIACGEPAAAVA